MATTNPFTEMLGEAESRNAAAREDLFALTDEQILEIAPDDIAINESAVESRNNDQEHMAVEKAQDTADNSAVQHLSSTSTSQEPPRWLAERIADPQGGAEARDFWNGIQQDRQEAAAFKEIFAKPEEARAVAERARALDEIDRAFFGVAGNSAEQSSVARAELAARMMQQDPAAFREMVFAGLRALESAQTQTSPERRATSSASAQTNSQQDARVSAYAAFEKAANGDLARSVGGAIERTLEQALPNAAVGGGSHAERSQRGGALKERLGNAIRQDIEKTLQADRQLGEQVAQILSGRQLDDGTRTQVVRLINERAQQLVPVAAKRVLQDWTQKTLAAHRTRDERANETTQEMVPAANGARNSANRTSANPPNAPAGKPRFTDYRKLSDEDILNL